MLEHPNVVAFVGVTQNPLQFVSDWMPNGTLREYITKNPGADRVGLVSISSITRTRLKIFYKLLDVAEGLNYLHAKYTTHGDLKGAGSHSTSLLTASMTLE
jgi:serine/threonine protein kinase